MTARVHSWLVFKQGTCDAERLYSAAKNKHPPNGHAFGSYTDACDVDSFHAIEFETPHSDTLDLGKLATGMDELFTCRIGGLQEVVVDHGCVCNTGGEELSTHYSITPSHHLQPVKFRTTASRRLLISAFTSVSCTLEQSK